MTDEELLLWLRIEDTNLTDFAADRIEELSKERDQHWDSFVHWRKEADDRSEQLAAARQDAEEAKAYADELEKERYEATRRRDAWKAKAEGYDAVRKALREKVGAPWPPNLSRALWAGIAADEKKRADDAEAKLAKAVEAMRGCRVWVENAANGDHPRPELAADDLRTLDAILAEIKGESHE